MVSSPKLVTATSSLASRLKSPTATIWSLRPAGEVCGAAKVTVDNRGRGSSRSTRPGETGETGETVAGTGVRGGIRLPDGRRGCRFAIMDFPFGWDSNTRKAWRNASDLLRGGSRSGPGTDESSGGRAPG